ncbi:MAG: hypothetical protein ACYC26_01150 [Phycisphaerales bacterium]
MSTLRWLAERRDVWHDRLDDPQLQSRARPRRDVRRDVTRVHPHLKQEL